MDLKEAQEIVSKLSPEEISDIKERLGWHEVFVIFPRTTINGDRVLGKCYRRFLPYEGGPALRNSPITNSKFLWKTCYATNKEVFHDKLKRKI